MPRAEKFWNFQRSSAQKECELHFYGDISSRSWDGDEVTPQAFQRELDSFKDTEKMKIYINSGGGDVYAGLAIYNMIKRAPQETTVYVDGIAASAASVIAMAADKIVMPKNAMMMIHNAWTFAGGNANKLRETVSKLERIDGTLAQIYSDRTGIDTETIRAMMDKETWMNGDEAVAQRFADEVEANKRFKACAEMDEYKAQWENAPDFNDFDSTEEVEAKDVETHEEKEKEPENVENEPINGGISEPVIDMDADARERSIKLKQMIIKMED